MSRSSYTAEISKGQGIIDETLALLDAWTPGISVSDLKEKARSEGIINRATALRIDDIVGRLFVPRFLSEEGAAARNMKQLLDIGVPSAALHQLFFLYAARAHTVFHDFVTQIYWPKYAAGAGMVTRQDALDFVESAKNTGLIDPPWSESTTVRIARYLGSALGDFSLAGNDRSGKRDILPYRMSALTGLYLAHELHFSGLNDNAILEANDWQLYGLDPMDVRHELERIAGAHFIIQFTGGLLRISWHYQTMEETLHAIAANELR